MGDSESDSSKITEKRKKFNFDYVHAGSIGGSLRLIIVVVGLIATILALIGFPHDLSSKNGIGVGTVADSCGEFYGYGLGYSYETLNVIHVVTVTIGWIFSFLFLLAMSCEGHSHDIAMKLNRFIYIPIGLLILGGSICGGIGTYYFWTGCCNVVFPDRSDYENGNGEFFKYLRSSYFIDSMSRNWCRCNYLTKYSGGGGGNAILVKYQYQNVGTEIISAWPHHFVTHIVSLAVGVLDAILCFIVPCFVNYKY